MKLGQVIRRYRVTSELTLRDVGREIGIGAATLMRLEQGRDPDGATLTKVLIWLFKPTTNGAQGKGRAVK
jgi:transcriptional regulator with XRE-family HTH domain